MELGLALRPGVFSAREALEIASASSEFSRFFIPDVSSRVDPLTLSLGIMLVRQDCRAGSGVIRAFEHDPARLAREAITMHEITGGRAFIGVGTGAAGKGAAGRLASFIKGLKGASPSLQVYAAALREGMARLMSGVADGIIINFSTYGHAGSMSRAFKAKGGLVSSYLKVFISQDQEVAERMAAEEVIKYSSYPQYGVLFDSEGISSYVSDLKAGRSSALRELEELGVLLVNPTAEGFENAVKGFKAQGVDVVVAYPYFEPSADFGFKLGRVKSLLG